MIPVEERTKREEVVFARPFKAGDSGEQPAGTYVVETVERLIDDLTFLAYRRVSTSIILPRKGGGVGSYEVAAIDPAVVETARSIAPDRSEKDRLA